MQNNRKIYMDCVFRSLLVQIALIFKIVFDNYAQILKPTSLCFAQSVCLPSTKFRLDAENVVFNFT